jgi:hypothetical protein
MSTGTAYSATPLARKLGIVAGTRVVARFAPDDYLELLEPLPEGVAFQSVTSRAADLVHLFVTEKVVMSKELAALRKKLRSDAVIWVSWPKKASKVPTDITEGAIRDAALPLGFVDIKVCAVTHVWSGLKLVVRRELR